MRLLALATALFIAPVAHAQMAVVGGEQALPGEWPDAAGVLMPYVGCTGTLIAPQVVLTAAHCVRGANVTGVLLDTVDWSKAGGERIGVERAVAHRSADIGVLVLSEPATVTPRAVATGCVLDYLQDGAPVSIVGFGITSANDQWNTELREGLTAIVDADCGSPRLGCNSRLDAGSELYAGGDGVDACSGDSGGPLYLHTEVGDYVVGATSRGPAGCRDGAIWVRPDAFLDWIEAESGFDIPEPTCNFPPTATAGDLTVQSGRSAHQRVDVVDPDGDERFQWEVLEDPEHGTVTVSDRGVVTYQADKDYVGADDFTVGATDTGYPTHTAPVTIAVQVVERTAFGCSTSGGLPASGAWLLGLGLLGLRRRRTAVANAARKGKGLVTRPPTLESL